MITIKTTSGFRPHQPDFNHFIRNLFDEKIHGALESHQ